MTTYHQREKYTDYEHDIIYLLTQGIITDQRAQDCGDEWAPQWANFNELYEYIKDNIVYQLQDVKYSGGTLGQDSSISSKVLADNSMGKTEQTFTKKVQLSYAESTTTTLTSQIHLGIKMSTMVGVDLTIAKAEQTHEIEMGFDLSASVSDTSSREVHQEYEIPITVPAEKAIKAELVAVNQIIKGANVILTYTLALPKGKEMYNKFSLAEWKWRNGDLQLLLEKYCVNLLEPKFNFNIEGFNVISNETVKYYDSNDNLLSEQPYDSCNKQMEAVTC